MRRRGATILENVLGFTLTALGLLGVVALLNSSLVLSSRAENQVHAEQMLQELMEFYAHDVHAMTDGSYALPYRQDSNRMEFRPLLTISTYDADPELPVRGVRLRIEWSHRGLHVRERIRLVCRLRR
jgi:hypothetical protein